MPVSEETDLSRDVIDDIIVSARYGDLEELQAIMSSHPVEYLLAEDEFGNTALHMASANGHADVVEYIIRTAGTLKEKVVANAQNESGNTPLHWGALNGHERVVELLVMNGADARIKNCAGRTATYEAQQNNHDKIVEFLLSNADIEKVDESEELEQNSENAYHFELPMTKTSPRRIPRRRDSSRQAALTFLTNISLGTEASLPSGTQKETAAPSRPVPGPYIDDPTRPPITVTEHDSFSEKGRPGLQTATTTPFDILPCKTASNNGLLNSEASSINGTEEYSQEFNSSGKTRLRSNSLRFLSNASLDSKKLKSNHPSKENLGSPSRERIADLEARENSDVENQENRNLKATDSPNNIYRRRRRRSSASTLKSESSSSSANSVTSPTSFDDESLSRRPSHQHSSSPKAEVITVGSLNAPLSIFSMLGYNDKKSKQGKHHNHSKRVANADSIKRQKAESFARLLEPSNSLSPELGLTGYDPTSLDNPELSPNDLHDFKSNKHRTVLSLSGLVGSLINHSTRPSDLKRESNELFRKEHPYVDPSLTLSQIRKIKAKLLTASRHDELDLELSTVAKAYAYFEKLILKNLVNKSNRRLIGGTIQHTSSSF
ncbi:5387_t:CDS:10 [Acaulospora colombiana]|uniref:5387_t:CDS:1 n=1 Tax=Acaulospora colombiana TaxID=27376 RepID=A0ACA9LBA2_9GLOM|nr:5387_t:CDS:10 [Acaulospora colombiana]